MKYSFIILFSICSVFSLHIYAQKRSPNLGECDKMKILTNIYVNNPIKTGGTNKIYFEVTGCFRYPSYLIYIEDSLVSTYIGSFSQDGDYLLFIDDSLSCIKENKFAHSFLYTVPKGKRRIKVQIENTCTGNCHIAYLKTNYSYYKLYHGQESRIKYSTEDYWHIRTKKYYKNVPLRIKLKLPLRKNYRLMPNLPFE